MKDVKENDSLVIETKDKYWIKTGAEVMHRDHQARKMYVDKMVKQTKIVRVADKDQSRVFVIGVDCHWIDDEGKYGTGRFLTMELMPWKKQDDIRN